MKVSEAIDILKKYPKDCEIYLADGRKALRLRKDGENVIVESTKTDGNGN